PAKSRPIRVGETIQTRMPKLAWADKVLYFDLVTPEAGPVTVDARAFDFEIEIEITRAGVGGKREVVVADDNSGIATNARAVFDAVAGGRYRIAVRCKDEDLFGEFELQVTAGKPVPLEFKAEQEAEMVYWKTIEERAAAQGDSVRVMVGLNGRATILQARGAYAEAKPLFERCVEMSE